MPEEGLSMAGESEWVVGFDGASQSHQVCLVDARGECLGERAVAHGGLGIEELCDWLIARTGATPEVIGVAIEMTRARSSKPCWNAVSASMGSIPSSSIGSATASPWPAPRMIGATLTCWATACAPIGTPFGVCRMTSQ